MKKLLFVFLLCLGFFMLGCSTTGYYSKLSAVSVEGSSLKKSGKFYVVRFEPDERNLNVIIADRLTLMGFDAATGEKRDMPNDIDTVVTYVDQWKWDMSNYMIEIDIQFRDAEDGALIMTGESYRRTLVRGTPETMIKETLEEMLKVTK